MSVSIAIVFDINYDEITSTLPFECKLPSQAWNVSISVVVHGVSTRILDPLLLLLSAFSPSRRQVKLLAFNNRSFALPLISIVLLSRHHRMEKTARNLDRAKDRKLQFFYVAFQATLAKGASLQSFRLGAEINVIR